MPAGIRACRFFSGHFPSGSSIAAPDELIAGIHWIDNRRRIGLDFAVVGESGKIGWDAGLRHRQALPAGP